MFGGSFVSLVRHGTTESYLRDIQHLFVGDFPLCFPNVWLRDTSRFTDQDQTSAGMIALVLDVYHFRR